MAAPARKIPFAVLIGAAVLLAAAAALLWSAADQAAPAAWQPLASRLPRQIDGWQGSDLPLGETEGERVAVGRLNYDDYVFRVYRKDGREVFVYAMHWPQGNISVREMAGHTPDGCWVANGARQCAAPVERTFAVGPALTDTAEVRTFEFPGGEVVNVAWWHFWGAELVDTRFSAKTVSTMFREVWLWLGHHRGERRDQMFVRIHSREPIGTAMASPVVTAFVQALPFVLRHDPGTGAESGNR